jgi:Fe-S-cluster containining protein
MNCKVCRGACCEIFEIGPLELRLKDRDHRYWFELHAVEQEPLTFECHCRSLTTEGRCGIYDKRPQMCIDFPAGGKHCLETVRKRRSRLDYSLIRDEGDPKCL